MSKYHKELSLAKDLVKKATEITEWFNKYGFKSYEKQDKSPVTIADFASQIFILSELKEKFSEDQIFAEEERSLISEDEESLIKKCFNEINFEPYEDIRAILNYRGPPSARQWTVDPIDGTKGYIRGLSYAVGIGLMENSDPKVCAISVPNYKKEYGAVFIAEKGKGAQASYGNQEFTLINVSPQIELKSSIMCQSLHHNAKWVVRLAEMIHAKNVIQMDGMGKFCMVADGSADLYVREMVTTYSSSWDYMPGILLVKEAGGMVSDLHNEQLKFKKSICLWTAPGLVVSNGIFHNEILDSIKKLTL